MREAYFFKKPSLLILEKPLWPELTEAGVCINCKPQKNEIISSFSSLESSNAEKSIPGVQKPHCKP